MHKLIESTKLSVVAATGGRIRPAGSVVVVSLAVVSGSLRFGMVVVLVA